MKKIFLLIIVLIALLSGVNALIQPEKTEVSVSATESFSLPVKIQNTSGEKALMHLTASGPVEAEFSANDFYLNPGEETVIALNLSQSTYPRTYYIELKLEYNSRTEYSEVNVTTGNYSGQINLRYYRQNICANQLDKLSFWVKNDTGILQKIRLSADSELFLPTIKPELIDLSSGEEKFVELELYSNNSFALDEYSVNVFLETNDSITSREIFFDLVECIETKNNFKLSVEDNYSNLRKEETQRIYFTVRNLAGNDNEIEFAVKSDLETELQQAKTVLAPNETRRYWIEVTPQKTAETGEHKIELYAFNAFNETRKTFFVNVRGMHEINAFLLNNNIEIKRGHSEIFSLLLENTGDFSERIRINAEETENINVHLSEESVLLDSKSEKKIFVSVNPTVLSELGKKEISLDAGGKEILIEFTVTEEKQPLITSGVIEFLSIPEKITLMDYSTKIKVVIKNISGEKIEDMVFWIEGLPDGTAFESNITKELEDGKTKTVEGTIFLDLDEKLNATYPITLVFENSRFRQKKTIDLVITKEQPATGNKDETNTGDFISGLISLGSAETIGLIVIALIVLILLVNPGKNK